MKKRSAIVLALSIVCVAAAAQSVPPDPQFVPLFNGRDLTGWVNVNSAPSTWSVRDGMIHSTGKPIGELRTARMYENFILELEWKHLKAGGNAGVFIWGDALPARGQPFVRAIEVQVLDGSDSPNHTSHGDVFSIHGARMTPDRPHPRGWERSLPTEKRAKPAGEWNHYRITANHGAIKLAVNGKEVSGGYDISPRKGYIHLESEGSPAIFRNLRIHELPSSGRLAPDQIATAYDGFVPLYTGVDLSGWAMSKGHEGHWAVNDWVISYDGRSEAPEKNLSSQKTYRDFAMILDWRAPDKRPAPPLPVLLRGREVPADVRAAVAARLEKEARPGEWNRALLTMKGDSVAVVLNGEEIVKDAKLPPGARGAGPIALQHHPQPLEFANVFVKELR